MTLLINKRQIAIIDESTKGTYNTALDSEATARANADFYPISPSLDPFILGSERDVAVPSLTPIEQFAPGVEAVELRFSAEIAGHRANVGLAGSADLVQPPFGKLLGYCGWRVEGGYAVEIPITSYDLGSLGKHRERFTEVVGGTKMLDLIGSIKDGLDTIGYFEGVAGVPSVGEQYDGGDTATRITIGAPTHLTNNFWTAYPVSDPSAWEAASIVYYVDGKRWKLKGARATPEFIFEHGKPARIQLRFLAIVESVVTAALLPQPLIAQTVPPAYLNTGLQFHDDTVAITGIVHNALSIAQNNDLVLREDSSTSTGWSFAGISSRGFTGSIAFDEKIHGGGGHDFRSDQENGVLYHARMVLGSGNGETLSFRLDGIQLSDLVEGDRDGVTTWDAQFALRSRIFSRADSTNPVTLGEDNEMVIINS